VHKAVQDRDLHIREGKLAGGMPPDRMCRRPQSVSRAAPRF